MAKGRIEMSVIENPKLNNRYLGKLRCSILGTIYEIAVIEKQDDWIKVLELDGEHIGRTSWHEIGDISFIKHLGIYKKGKTK